MAQKSIIHMQLANEAVPFDVSLYRAIKFSLAKHRDIEAAKSELEKAVQAVLTEGYQVENPVTRARGRIKLEEHATPDQRVILEELAALRSRVNRIDRTTTSEYRGFNQYRFWLEPGIEPFEVLDRAKRNFRRAGIQVYRSGLDGPFALSIPDAKMSDEFLSEITSIPGVLEAEFVGFHEKPPARIS